MMIKLLTKFCIVDDLVSKANYHFTRVIPRDFGNFKAAFDDKITDFAKILFVNMVGYESNAGHYSQRDNSA